MSYLDMRSDQQLATARLSFNILDQSSLCIISDCITLVNVSARQSASENFNQDPIDAMSYYLSTD